MWNRLFSPQRRIFRAALCIVLPLLATTGCNLNTPQGGEEQAITGAPIVRMIAPLPNAPYREGVGVPIQAQISNAGSDIDRVEVSVDGTVVQTFAAPNPDGRPAFSITHTWPAAGSGTHSIDVIAFRADGSASPSVAVSITVVVQGAVVTDEPQPSPSGGTQTTGGQQVTATRSQPPAATNTPQPTQVPASATPNTPQITTRQGINVRGGPGTNFNPPIGSLAAGATAPLVARNPAGDWYKIRYYNGEGWVFAGLVDVSGDTASLPIDPGPPTPIPATPTPLIPTAPPATPVPATSANLVAGNVRIDNRAGGSEPICAQTFDIYFDVANLGTQPTTVSGIIEVRDVRVSDGSQQGITQGAFGIIQAGQTVNIGPIPLTVSTYYNEQHRVILRINPNGAVPENNPNDNTREVTFTLQKGACP
jgi:hypothetical protein